MALDETLTIKRSQLIAWMASPKASDCLWDSLKTFLADDAAFFATLEEKAPKKIDHSLVASKIFEICGLHGMTPYNLLWIDPTHLEIIFMDALDPNVKRDILDALGGGDLSIDFSIWDGTR